MILEYTDIIVAGLHLSGQPLNHQLITMGGKLKRSCLTAALYKMFVIKDERGIKPGLIRMPNQATGSQYEVEIWELPLHQLGKLLLSIPPPLGLGTVWLDDGKSAKGFICEPCVLEEGEDISTYKGWRAYLANKSSSGI